MKKHIQEFFKRFGNRLKARADHKNRVRYTKHDVFTSMLYEDFNQKVVSIKLPNIAEVYGLDLTKHSDFVTACMIAETDITNMFLK